MSLYSSYPAASFGTSTVDPEAAAADKAGMKLEEAAELHQAQAGYLEAGCGGGTGYG